MCVVYLAMPSLTHSLTHSCQAVHFQRHLWVVMDHHTSLLVIHSAISSALPIPVYSKSPSKEVFLCPPLFCMPCFGCHSYPCSSSWKLAGDVWNSGLQTSSFSVVSFMRVAGDFQTVPCLIYNLSSSPGGQSAAFKWMYHWHSLSV